jgi:hypothetical protein
MLKITNIPKPSNDILELVIDITTSKDIPKDVTLLNKPDLNWWSVHLKNECNIVKSTILYSHLLVSMIREQYGPFLRYHILNPYIVVFENTNPSCSAYYVPHTDPKRMTAFNYYLDYGGDSATLSTYNECDWNEEPKVKDWEDLTLLKQYQLNTSNWYCFDTKRFHSVDNIQTKRILISMSPMNPKLETNIGPPNYNRETDSFEAITTMYSEIFQEY